MIAHAHGYDLSALLNQAEWMELYRESLPKIENIVVVSDHMRARIVHMGVSPAHVHVISCGTDVQPTTLGNREEVSAATKILAVGRLIGKKGPMYLLETFRRVVSAMPSAHLTVIGDGPYLEPMRQLVRAMGISLNTHLLGGCSNEEVRRQLRLADVFVQHSVTADDGDEEGLPVAILEAMACGVPVVSTSSPGLN